MKRLLTISIRGKQIAALMITTWVALGLACAGFFARESITFRQSLESELASLAQVVAANVAGALSFNDTATAEEMLRACLKNRLPETAV